MPCCVVDRTHGSSVYDGDASLRSSAARVAAPRAARGIPPRPWAARVPAAQAGHRGMATAIGYANSGSVCWAPGALSIPSTAHGATAEAAHKVAARVAATGLTAVIDSAWDGNADDEACSTAIMGRACGGSATWAKRTLLRSFGLWSHRVPCYDHRVRWRRRRAGIHALLRTLAPRGPRRRARWRSPTASRSSMRSSTTEMESRYPRALEHY